jgi:2-keto-4-pentenoate hydratase
MDTQARRVLAEALVEAFETGNPIVPLPSELLPADAAAGEAVAEAVLDALALVPCGLRSVLQPDGSLRHGPLLESRLMRDGASLPLAALRHARVSAAAVGVLGAALDPGASAPPVLAAIHPAIDIATTRFRDGAAGAGAEAADLGGIGHVVVGRRAAVPAGPVAVSCAAEPRRPRGVPSDLAHAFAEAAAAARRLGGLPAGALLVVAGLTPPAEPAPGESWTARLSGLGRARVDFVAAAEAA